MAKIIKLQIEVSEAGLHAARMEIQTFLSHQSTCSGDMAATSWVVLRRLLQQTDREVAKQEQEAKAIEAKRPRPSIREMRKKAA